MTTLQIKTLLRSPIMVKRTDVREYPLVLGSLTDCGEKLATPEDLEGAGFFPAPQAGAASARGPADDLLASVHRHVCGDDHGHAEAQETAQCIVDEAGKRRQDRDDALACVRELESAIAQATKERDEAIAEARKWQATAGASWASSRTAMERSTMPPPRRQRRGTMADRQFDDVIAAVIAAVPENETALLASLQKVQSDAWYAPPEIQWHRYGYRVANILLDAIGTGQWTALSGWQRAVVLAFNPTANDGDTHA